MEYNIKFGNQNATQEEVRFYVVEVAYENLAILM